MTRQARDESVGRAASWRVALVFFSFLVVAFDRSTVAGEPQKYALMIAVQDYEQPEMNAPQLKFTEADAIAVGEKFTNSGYVVETLLGQDAKRDEILNKLATLKSKGSSSGIVVIGLFGHGLQRNRVSYFCPHDARGEFQLDAQGKTKTDALGNKIFVGLPETLLSIDTFLAKLGSSPATQRVLLADCCRFDSTVTRGRSVGSELKNNDLPLNTGVLFACSEEQKAYEHHSWGHGAFSKCLLEAFDRHSFLGDFARELGGTPNQPGTVQVLVDQVRLESDASQKPSYLSNATAIDLSLKIQPQTPSERMQVQLAGQRSGEIRVFARHTMVWCDIENQSFDNGFWISQSEVSQSTWRAVMNNSSPWTDVRRFGKVRDSADQPVTCVTQAEAKTFCEAFFHMLQKSGELPDDAKVKLPTVKQWDYACTAAGNDASGLPEGYRFEDIAWYRSPSNQAIEAQSCKKKHPNSLGLYDMLGNVSEWCEVDSSGLAPHRGGSFLFGEKFLLPNDSAVKANNEAYTDIGFRMVLTR